MCGITEADSETSAATILLKLLLSNTTITTRTMGVEIMKGKVHESTFRRDGEIRRVYSEKPSRVNVMVLSISYLKNNVNLI